MIKFENTEAWGFEHAIRGARNPMNSWAKSDSHWCDWTNEEDCKKCGKACLGGKERQIYILGDNDLDLAKRLCKAGTDHRKFIRQIFVSVDITAPDYWFKEFSTYKVGTVENSSSTMHRIHSKEFTLDDFSCEHLDGHNTETQTTYPNDEGGVDGWYPLEVMDLIINSLNQNRQKFIETKDKKYWWQMIQLLPMSYNYRRTVTMNYENIRNMYHARKNHKLDEWSQGFTDWVKTLPYAKELIIGEED